MTTIPITGRDKHTYGVIENNHRARWSSSPGKIPREKFVNGVLSRQDDSQRFTDIAVTRIFNHTPMPQWVWANVYYGGAWLWLGDDGRYLNCRFYHRGQKGAVSDFSREDLHAIEPSIRCPPGFRPVRSRHKNDTGAVVHPVAPKLLKPGEFWNHYVATSVAIDSDAPKSWARYYPLIRKFYPTYVQWGFGNG